MQRVPVGSALAELDTAGFLKALQLRGKGSLMSMQVRFEPQMGLDLFDHPSHPPAYLNMVT